MRILRQKEFGNPLGLIKSTLGVGKTIGNAVKAYRKGGMDLTKKYIRNALNKEDAVNIAEAQDKVYKALTRADKTAGKWNGKFWAKKARKVNNAQNDKMRAIMAARNGEKVKQGFGSKVWGGLSTYYDTGGRLLARGIGHFTKKIDPRLTGKYIYNNVIGRATVPLMVGGMVTGKNLFLPSASDAVGLVKNKLFPTAYASTTQPTTQTTNGPGMMEGNSATPTTPKTTTTQTTNGPGMMVGNSASTTTSTSTPKTTPAYNPTAKVTFPFQPTTATNDQINTMAADVMSGKYGNGATRRKALGANYKAVQNVINKKYYGL